MVVNIFSEFQTLFSVDMLLCSAYPFYGKIKWWCVMSEWSKKSQNELTENELMDYEHICEMEILWAHFLDSSLSTIMSSWHCELTVLSEMGLWPPSH